MVRQFVNSLKADTQIKYDRWAEKHDIWSNLEEKKAVKGES